MKNSLLTLTLISFLTLNNACKKENPTKTDTENSCCTNVDWLQIPENRDKQVDVFYVYPTVYSSNTVLNMDITDPNLQEKARIATRKQASVFTDTCNLYAPYYRQMSMAVLTDSTLDIDSYFEIAYDDVKQAFICFIEEENKGQRPFILAGHSQGSEMLLNLMMDPYFTDSILNQMVAAYLIGYSVTTDDLDKCDKLKIAQQSNDLHVIITYNTQSDTNLNSPILLPGAQCVNPLLWTTSNTPAGSAMNHGTAFFDSLGNITSLIPNFTNAKIDLGTGTLLSTDPNIDTLTTKPFDDGIYHLYDYNFFYQNLKENVNERVGAFLNQ